MTSQPAPSSQLTANDWAAIGSFGLLIIGLAFVNPSLAGYVGVGAILVIALKGWGLK